MLISKALFQHLRAELEVEVPKAAKKLPYVPTEEELKLYYDVAWQAKEFSRHDDREDASVYGHSGQ
ncbi:hypothetical protein [Paenibacillus sp. FSL W8-0194]|uniref:hypothetical protein n=1 Tax=Paenibacillus sp. FSL W8-0194 TaxID=2921711 RepID=UPI0030D7917D